MSVQGKSGNVLTVPCDDIHQPHLAFFLRDLFSSSHCQLQKGSPRKQMEVPGYAYLLD